MSRRCDGKVPYRTMPRAELAAAKKSLQLSELLIAYECCDCGRFHIGHADQSQKAARAKTETELQQAIFKYGLRAVQRAAAKKGKSISTDPLDASRSTVECSCKQGIACGAKRCRKRRARQRRAQREKAQRTAQDTPAAPDVCYPANQTNEASGDGSQRPI